MRRDPALELVRKDALWFEPAADGLRPLLEAIGDAGLVLIGEATHGTHEFYYTRAGLTKALIIDHGFDFVAVEADWPDAYRVNEGQLRASFHDVDLDRFLVILRKDLRARCCVRCASSVRSG